MKYLAGLLCLMAACIAYTHGISADEIKAKLTGAAAECKQKTEATDAEIEAIMHHDVPETVSGKCFVGCVKQHFGVITPDHKVNLDNMKELIGLLKERDEDLYNKVITIAEACTSEATGSDECELGANLMKCAVEKAKEMGIDKGSLM